MRCFRRTGFSREEARCDAINFAVWRLALSRLKPVPQGYAVFLRTRLSREEARFDAINFAVWRLTLPG